MQADMVLELDPEAAGCELCHIWTSLSIGDFKAQSTEVCFLQQGHTYSNKATPPNHATSNGGHFLSNHQQLIIFLSYIIRYISFMYKSPFPHYNGHVTFKM